MQVMMRLEDQHSTLSGDRERLAAELAGLTAQLEQSSGQDSAEHAKLAAQVAAIVQAAQVSLKSVHTSASAHQHMSGSHIFAQSSDQDSAAHAKLASQVAAIVQAAQVSTVTQQPQTVWALHALLTAHCLEAAAIFGSACAAC